MTARDILAAAMLIALIVYVLLGGADFGGGVWDLLAAGPRRREQRVLIEKALGPIWEANHVWLILVAVLLFSAFPPAFAAVTTTLHVPLTLFLVGIVFRGSAFTFRSYDTRGDRVQQRWGLVFSLASIVSPLLLGMCAGALASGDLRWVGGVAGGGFVDPWLRPFPVAAGVYALTLCAFLSAVYLANEARDDALRDDFRKRAIASGALVGACALVAFALSFEGAPRIRAGLTDRPWTWPLHLATGVSALTALHALWRRRWRMARVAAAAQTTLILLGWTASQFPYLIVPDVTLAGAAGNPRTQRLLVVALGLGSLLLFPSLFLLYRIFKGEQVFAVVDATTQRPSALPVSREGEGDGEV